MDPVTLARFQFGLTIIFHYLYPPVSIGMAWLITYMAWRAWKGDKVYDEMTRFWVKILAMVFAVGVATGITMEFQFGTNWSTYSRFVGDIFGSPLAAEGVFAFFMESSFIGVLILGRNKVSKGFYAFSAFMVALGSTLSAFWIIVANSWQQTPTAYEVVDGVARLTNFWAAVFNPSTLPRFFHTICGALLTGSFFIAGAGAWYLLQGRHVEFARRSLQVGVTAGAIFSLLILGVGHIHAVQVYETQPAKMAAYEALFETQDGAAMILWGFPDVEKQKVYLNIAVPKLLSLLIHFDPNSTITGLDQFPREEWPPISAAFYPYHLMTGLGFFFIALTWWGLLMGQKREKNQLFLKVMVYSSWLPLLTMNLGWVAAEFGRQPWVVYGELKTADAVSVVVPAWQVLLTIILFVGIYSLLLGLLLFLLKRELDEGPKEVTA